jgi:Zn-dependent peptidase ImmA (M78 family)
MIENKGIFIHCFMGVDVNLLRGIAIHDDKKPIIGINSKDNHSAKSFTVIHELVHILKRQSAVCNETGFVPSYRTNDPIRQEEIFCNAVAGEVLVPSAVLNEMYGNRPDKDILFKDAEESAKKFSVRLEVIARRLLDTKIISKKKYGFFMKKIQAIHKKQKEELKDGSKSYCVNVARETFDKNSAALCSVLLYGFGEEYFSIYDLTGILKIKEKDVENFIKEAKQGIKHGK